MPNEGFNTRNKQGGSRGGTEKNGKVMEPDGITVEVGKSLVEEGRYVVGSVADDIRAGENVTVIIPIFKYRIVEIMKAMSQPYHEDLGQSN